MQRNLSAIWMVAQREFTDQFRDWRIVVPMFLLVTLFPFIADDTTRQAVSFMNRFGGDLILDNLIPFVVLVIGFFPLSFTLVVALESFVGEKEREGRGGPECPACESRREGQARCDRGRAVQGA